MAADGYVLKPIGVVRSPLRDRVDAPRQGSEGAPDAWILLEPSVADALQGIAAGDQLVVVTWLHEAQRDVLQVHPRDDTSRRPQALPAGGRRLGGLGGVRSAGRFTFNVLADTARRVIGTCMNRQERGYDDGREPPVRDSRGEGRRVLKVDAEASVFEAVQLMVEKNVGSLLVTESGDITGIVTERDYLRRVTLEGRTDGRRPFARSCRRR